MFDQIKRGNGSPAIEKQDPSEGDTVGKIRAETSTTQLKNFINNLT